MTERELPGPVWRGNRSPPSVRAGCLHLPRSKPFRPYLAAKARGNFHKGLVLSAQLLIARQRLIIFLYLQACRSKRCSRSCICLRDFRLNVYRGTCHIRLVWYHTSRGRSSLGVCIPLPSSSKITHPHFSSTSSPVPSPSLCPSTWRFRIQITGRV